MELQHPSGGNRETSTEKEVNVSGSRLENANNQDEGSSSTLSTENLTVEVDNNTQDMINSDEQREGEALSSEIIEEDKGKNSDDDVLQILCTESVGQIGQEITTGLNRTPPVGEHHNIGVNVRTASCLTERRGRYKRRHEALQKKETSSDDVFKHLLRSRRRRT